MAMYGDEDRETKGVTWKLLGIGGILLLLLLLAIALQELA